MDEATTHPLFSKVDALGSLDEDMLERFFGAAMNQIEGHIRSNQRTAERMDMDATPPTDELLDPSNVESIQVRARAFENPRVTLWLKDCPTWANDAWTENLYPNGMNAYNGKVHTILDVRPY